MTPRRTVGVLIGYSVYESNTINEYLLSVFQGIQAAAQAYDCNLLIAGGLNSPSGVSRSLPAWPVYAEHTSFVPLGPWNTDGWIVIPPVALASLNDYLNDLSVGGFPMVFTEVDQRGPSVVTDNVHGMFQAVEHLVSHGHRQIAYIAGHQNLIGDSSVRLEAFHTALRAFHIEPDPHTITYSQHTFDGGRAAMKELLDGGHQFTAVVASNLRAAIGAMETLDKAGYRIPDDMALIAVDDHIDAEAHVPPITAIGLQTFEQGFQALRVLLDYIDGKHAATTTVSLPSYLVIRRSCGCHSAMSGISQLVTVHTSSELAADSVVDRMVAATRIKAYHLTDDDLAPRFRLLIDTFAQSLSDANEAPFLLALGALLTYVESAHADAHAIHDALSVLIQHIDTFVSPDTIDCRPLILAYQLIDAARVAINEHIQHHMAQERVELAFIGDRLGVMTARLLATLDGSDLLKIMATHLPEIGIRHGQIAILEAEDDDPVAWSTLWMQHPDTDEVMQQRIRTSAFPPPDLYPADKPFQLLLIPLLAQGAQIGYMVYDAGRVAVCGAITRQIAAALISFKLYGEATESRRLADEANQLKTRFLSMVSHELRTPLSVIVGLSELALREEREGKLPTRQDLERIYSSAHHLSFLIRDVLDLASSQAGQLRLTHEAFDIVEAMQPVMITGEQLAYDKGLAWHVELPEQHSIVLGDRTRLRQVALNLITNAVKFTAHGAITFSIESVDQQVSIAVRDTGIGIPLAEQTLIFDEFRQSERTAARGYGGLGLGLAISRHLVELHGGTMSVRSSGIEDAGTMVSFSIPTLAHSPLPDAPNIHTPLVVMLVTSRVAATQVSDLLRSHDLQCEFQTYALAESWVDHFAEMPPDVLLVEKQADSEQWNLLHSLPTTQPFPVVFYTLHSGTEESLTLELEYHHVPLSIEQLAQLLDTTLPTNASFSTILLIDDDAGMQEMYTRLIQSAIPESQVIQASNGRDALAIVRHTRPDLVLLDLMMPELDGFATLEALQANDATRDIPVIVLSDKALTEGEIARLSHSLVVLEKGVITVDEVLAHITKALDATRRVSSTTQYLVRRAIAFIHAHYAEPLTREAIARYVSVSENYLTNCFQREIGISPLTFLNRYRIKQARGLLEQNDSNMTMTAIAVAVGFVDTGYFSRIFQREVGMSPSAYRRTYGKR